MSKKKLLEFGLKEADAFQKNFKIILDRLIRGYKSVMGKDPEGLDLLKVRMEAREKAINTTKVVNQKGLTLDPDKPIVGGTQEGIETIKTKFDEFNLSKDDPMGDLEKIIKGEGDTGLPKNYTRPFGDNIRDAYREAGRSREDASEIIEALGSPGAKKSYEIMEEVLGVRLYGDETFEELMKIKETGVHPRGEPPIKKADGGKVPAAPSQLVSESDMILGYRGDDAYGGGSGTGGGGGEERDPRSDYMGMKGKTRVGPGPSQQGGPKSPLVTLNPVVTPTTQSLQIPNIGLQLTALNRARIKAMLNPTLSLIEKTPVGDVTIETAIGPVSVTGTDNLRGLRSLNLSTGIGPLGVNLNTDLAGTKNLGIGFSQGPLSITGTTNLEGVGNIGLQYSKSFKDGGLASMFVERR